MVCFLIVIGSAIGRNRQAFSASAVKINPKQAPARIRASRAERIGRRPRMAGPPLLDYFRVMVPSQVPTFFSCLSSSLNHRDVTHLDSV